MKRFIKYTAVIGMLFVILGSMLTIGARISGAAWDYGSNIGFFHSGFNWFSSKKMNKTVLSERKQVFSRVENLSLEFAAADVNVVTDSAAEQVIVELESPLSDADVYHFYQQDETVYGRAAGAVRGRSGQNLKLTITLPRDIYFEEVELNVAGAEVTVEKLQCQSLRTQLAAGKVTFQQAALQQADLQTMAGALYYNGNIEESLKAECMAGSIDISVDQQETEFDYEAETMAGSIRLGDRTLSGFADKYKKDNDASRQMRLETAGGKISVFFAR